MAAIFRIGLLGVQTVHSWSHTHLSIVLAFFLFFCIILQNEHLFFRLFHELVLLAFFDLCFLFFRSIKQRNDEIVNSVSSLMYFLSPKIRKYEGLGPGIGVNWGRPEV